MKEKIVARDKEHLIELINNEIKINSYECDLNHIDVSNIKNISYLFNHSKFNGDISQWDVSNVKDMDGMFYQSDFNSDISQWDVSNVKSMSYMFYKSNFNGDISQWDVSNNCNCDCDFMFYESNHKFKTYKNSDEIKQKLKEEKIIKLAKKIDNKIAKKEEIKKVFKI